MTLTESTQPTWTLVSLSDMNVLVWSGVTFMCDGVNAVRSRGGQL